MNIGFDTLHIADVHGDNKKSQKHCYIYKIFVQCKMNPSCKRCDIGYLIKDHMTCIVQLLTNDLPEYNFRLQTTKCLNTAVLLMNFLLGKQGLKMADSCDTKKVIERHQSGKETNAVIIDALRKQLMSTREKSRTLYYVLLSDGYFPKADTSVYFPGHVFVLEKVWDAAHQTHFYYFYQSYINQYTLNGHIERNKGLQISKQRVQHLIKDVETVLMSRTWTEENVKRWFDLTFTDSVNFKDSQSNGKFFLCFRKARVTTCLGRLEKYLTQKLVALRKMEKMEKMENLDDVYGNASLYDQNAIPLSNQSMLDEIQILLRKIKSVKSR